MAKGYFFYGQEVFLVDEAVESIKNQHVEKQLTVFEDQISIQTVIQTVQSTGLFATGNLIILKNPAFILKSYKCLNRARRINASSFA